MIQEISKSGKIIKIAINFLPKIRQIYHIFELNKGMKVKYTSSINLHSFKIF